MNSLRELKLLQLLFKTKNLIYLHRKISFFYTPKREKNIFKKNIVKRKNYLLTKKSAFYTKKENLIYLNGKIKVFYVHPEEKNLKKKKINN